MCKNCRGLAKLCTKRGFQPPQMVSARADLDGADVADVKLRGYLKDFFLRSDAGPTLGGSSQSLGSADVAGSHGIIIEADGILRIAEKLDCERDRDVSQIH